MRIQVAENVQGPHGGPVRRLEEEAIRLESSALCEVLVPLEIKLFLRSRTGEDSMGTAFMGSFLHIYLCLFSEFIFGAHLYSIDVDAFFHDWGVLLYFYFNDS